MITVTTFEGISIFVLWVGYGLFAAYQSKGLKFHDDWQWFIYPTFAPLVFICKALYGAFKTYGDK